MIEWILTTVPVVLALLCAVYYWYEKANEAEAMTRWEQDRNLDLEERLGDAMRQLKVYDKVFTQQGKQR